jgi:carboxymethylenebutenolidase
MTLTQITIESENKLGSLPGYVTSGDRKAGVIVIQEWWGVNEQIKKLAEDWFSDKFVALVPDLYRGNVATDHEHAGHLFSGLDWPGAVQDIQGAVNYFHSKNITKVGVVGFCMGGALSIAAAVKVNGIHASAPFYGIPSKELADPALAKVPLQLHFGTKDSLKGFSDTEAQDALEKVLKDANVSYEFYRYDGADHAFVNQSNPEKYNAEYAKLSHQRVIEFFEKHLTQ